MEFKVTGEKGIKYLDKSQNIVIVKKGSIIRQSDIDNKFFSIGGLERLEKDKRVIKYNEGQIIKPEEKVDPLNDPLNDDQEKVISPTNKKQKKGKTK